MLYATLKAIHVLSIIVWIGGMMFVAMFLRPALAALEPVTRVTLMHDVLGRFFKAVLVVSIATLLSGLWMIGRVAKLASRAGGPWTMPIEWTIMAALGVLMILIFGYLRFVLYPRLTRAVSASNWPAGGAALASLRQGVAINLVIGVLIVVVVTIGLPK
jgi:uncharacterized membrane protein